MSPTSNKIALFIDGANLYATAKTLGFDIDYTRLLLHRDYRGSGIFVDPPADRLARLQRLHRRHQGDQGIHRRQRPPQGQGQHGYRARGRCDGARRARRSDRAVLRRRRFPLAGRGGTAPRRPGYRGAMTTISTIENDPGGQPPALVRTEPDRNCPLCPRLASFREDARAREPEWFNSPVPSFGDPDGRLLIVGLAPGLQGANRTGRPFTGDFAGDLLYATLLEYGFAKGKYQARPDDGLTLIDCRISNAVRCVPPQNKPLPTEISTCRQFLSATTVTMPRLPAIVALVRVANLSRFWIRGTCQL